MLEEVNHAAECLDEMFTGMKVDVFFCCCEDSLN